MPKYVICVSSSRRLEAEIYRNIKVRWLLRHMKPGIRTVAATISLPQKTQGQALTCPGAIVDNGNTDIAAR